jgi:uncharacterized protein YlxP (DUF503 family)
MNVAVCRLTLRLPENHDLKGKRRAIGSICSRVRQKFNVSIAEVGDNDAWQVATLGITSASNDAAQADKVVSAVVDFIASGREDVEIIGQEQEVIAGF